MTSGLVGRTEHETRPGYDRGELLGGGVSAGGHLESGERGVVMGDR